MKTALPRAVTLAAALCAALLPASAASEFPVFRWKSSLSANGGTVPTPDGGGNNEPTPDPTPADPLAGPTTHLRVTVDSFAGNAAGALSELAFSVGTTRLAPTAAAIPDNVGTGEQNAFDGNTATAWAGDAALPSATFVYEIPVGANPDHLEIVATGPNAPSAFTIARSPNALSWIPVVSYAGETGWSGGEKRRYPFTLAPKPSPESAAHKHWRVAVENWNTDAYSGLTEVVFRDGTGADVTVGGKGTVVGATPGRHKYPFDKDPATAWYDDAYKRRPTTFQYEFAQPQALASVDITADYGLAGPPQKFRIESSDDGNRWAVEARYPGQGGWVAEETRNFPIPDRKPNPGEHQFWRAAILMTHAANGVGSLNDLDVLDASGASLTARAVAIASSRESHVYAETYFSDKKNSNQWRSLAGEAMPWAGYAFPEPVTAERLRIRADGSASPRDLAVEWSDDGETWVRTSKYAGHGNWLYATARDFPVKQPPAPPSDHHRHWRVYVEETENPASADTSVYELTFAGADGARLPLTGIPIAGSFNGNSYTAARAFDENKSWTSTWTSAKVPEWIGYEFPEAVKPAAVKIASGTAIGPETFRIEWSDDGDAWTEIARFSGNGSWNYDERTFPMQSYVAGPGEHQYWRINVTANNGNTKSFGLAELDFVAADGVDRHVGGNPIAAKQHRYYPAKNAFDNNPSSSFSLDLPVLPTWVGYAFPRPVPVNEVRIAGANTSNASVRDFEIQWSDNGIDWTTIETYANAGNWDPREVRVFPIPKPKEQFEEAYGYAINMRQIVPQGFAGTVSPMSLNNVKLVGGDGRPVAFKGTPSVKHRLDDKTIANAFDTHTSSDWVAGDREARIDIGLALPMRVTDFESTVTAGCTGCEVEMILYRFIGPEATGTRDEVVKRTVR